MINSKVFVHYVCSLTIRTTNLLEALEFNLSFYKLSI